MPQILLKQLHKSCISDIQNSEVFYSKKKINKANGRPPTIKIAKIMQARPRYKTLSFKNC